MERNKHRTANSKDVYLLKCLHYSLKIRKKRQFEAQKHHKIMEEL